MATRLTTATFGYQNFYSALLTGDIAAGTLTIGVDTVPTPTAGILVIDPDSTTLREVILYTSKGASTVVCPSDGRGYSGSTAAAHLTGTTVIMAPVDKWFTALASGELSSDPLRTELFFDYIASGCVLSADSVGASLAASMTSGVIYILGKRLTVATVTARAYTLNKDTYIDATDNSDGTALLTYTEVANNAASPALATNAIRIGIIQSGATITATTKVNQGQEDRVFPIASSIPYAVTDTLGNLICPRDPNRRLLGYRQILTNFATASTSFVDITAMTTPVIVPTGRKVKITIFSSGMQNTGASALSIAAIVESSTVLANEFANSAGTSGNLPVLVEFITSPSAGLHTYKGQLAAGAGTSTILAGTTPSTSVGGPAFIRVELL